MQFTYRFKVAFLSLESTVTTITPEIPETEQENYLIIIFVLRNIYQCGSSGAR